MGAVGSRSFWGFRDVFFLAEVLLVGLFWRGGEWGWGLGGEVLGGCCLVFFLGEWGGELGIISVCFGKTYKYNLDGSEDSGS